MEPSKLTAFDEALNKYGAEGWELVTAVREEQLNVTVYWLKRPKA